MSLEPLYRESIGPASEAEMTRNRLRRRGKYNLSRCGKGCTLNPDNLPGKTGDLVHAWYEEGDNDAQILEKAATLGVKLSNGSIGRHRQNHLVRADGGVVDPTKREMAVKKTDLQVLEEVISRGSEMLDLTTSRITTEQLLRAIELKHKLTEGSVFESFFGVLEAEGESALGGGEESPEAVRSEDEAAEEAPPSE